MKFLKTVWSHTPSRAALLSLIFLLLALVFQLDRGGVTWKVFALISVAVGGFEATLEAIESIKNRKVDVHILMVLAAIGAIALGDYIEAAGLLFLFCLGEALESFAMTRTKSAIESLVKLRPQEATVLENGTETIRPVQMLEIGDLILVRPFGGLPADGTIIEGNSSINASAMTGESRPIEVGAGDKILAGTQNLEGLLTIRVSARVGESTLDRIVSLVAEAQSNKASGERIASWFGEKYTFLVLGAFAASIVIRLGIHQPTHLALYDSLTLLVGMSPCALVISAPAATLSALAWGAKNGMLIRGGEFIEKAAKIDVVALDKTGTLTKGQPILREICLCHEPVLAGFAGVERHENCWIGDGSISNEASKFLVAAAGIERHSDHPLAKAMIDKLNSESLNLAEGSQVEVVPGMGMTGEINGKRIAVGTERLLFKEGLKWPDHMNKRIKEMQEDGLTASYVAIDDDVAAFGFGDDVRPETEEMIRELKTLGIKEVAVLSGDNLPTVKAVASRAGVSMIHADLLPADKAQLIRDLSLNHSVMMVGDGVNDAPSLAGATIGVAMGGLGSDVALEAADVVLMNDNLCLIPKLIRLGRRANRIIMGNLIFAGAVVVALTIGSIVTQVPLMLAVAAHEGSTVIVILSGLRLLSGPK